MAAPPARVSQNDSNLPTSAAARAGYSRNPSVSTDSPVIGASKIPATAASAEPIAQLIAATRSGDRASAASATSFSALARVAIPNFVRL